MKTLEFNERVREAARHQRLPGYLRLGEGTMKHRWKVAIEKVDAQGAKDFDFGINPLTGQPFFSAWVFSKAGRSTQDRLWRVFVGPGSVCDEPACMEYLAGADPRGWIMPANYAPYLALQAVFGAKYPFVDRPLVEDPAPFLYLTAPSADLSDMGGFAKTADARRPQFFRTAETLSRQLYQASVVVTLSPYRADPAAVSLQVGGARARRWRVTVGKLPTAVEDAGISKIASKELARIYLLRTPGRPELDEVFIQQESPDVGVCWNLWARSSVDMRFLELLGLTAEAVVGLDLGLLALGLAGITVAEVLVGIEEGVIAIILANLEAIVAATSSVQFWNV